MDLFAGAMFYFLIRITHVWKPTNYLRLDLPDAGLESDPCCCLFIQCSMFDECTCFKNSVIEISRSGSLYWNIWSNLERPYRWTIISMHSSVLIAPSSSRSRHMNWHTLNSFFGSQPNGSFRPLQINNLNSSHDMQPSLSSSTSHILRRSEKKCLANQCKPISYMCSTSETPYWFTLTGSYLTRNKYSSSSSLSILPSRFLSMRSNTFWSTL